MFNRIWNKKYTIVAVFFLLAFFKVQGQNCNLSIEGYIFDEASQLPLSFVNVLVQETSQGTMTDDKGNFSLDNLCVGEYHIHVSHIGCESEKFHIHVPQEHVLKIGLTHTQTSLGAVVVEGKGSSSLDDQPNVSVNRKTIEDNTNKNLSNLLENEAGVHLIKNGSGISKPVVHGLYGNRLTVLNNGIAQSGQQWGNDHSPEIDPYAADKIIVLKGANAIEYGGGNLGSVVLVEPKRIPHEPHLHGQASYAYESNGHGHNLNARIGKYSDRLAWRVNGTLKKYGDRKSARYFLNNTGLEEANLSLQLEKFWNDKFSLDFYGSTFNTRLGVLRGSHIGNLTDLESALTQEVPFFTEPNFSYQIEAPRQQVSHHLAKIKAKYFINDGQILELVTAGQINDRKEFDVRRSGRSDIPAMSLLQYTFNVELKYSHILGNDWKLVLGNQNILTDNTNNPETGILPLIPDYSSWESGLFSTISKRKEKTSFKFGLRYDLEHQKVAAISTSIPREIIRYENTFHNITGLSSIKYNVTKSQSLALSSGYAMRNPGINEFYSSGLHQGVSGIEEGDPGLKTEKAIKNTLEYKWFPNTNFTLNALAYHQHFKDYIFLNPQDEVRLTIRGAFPVFKYEQTDANIYGLDISTQFTINNSILGVLKYSYIRGDDIKNNTPLVFMPPNSLYGSLNYQVKKDIKISKNLKMEELEFEINNKLVFQQNHILAEQDFVQPPPMYNLLGMKVSTNIILPQYKIRCFIKADNLLNTQYRDYLNRQRYFADDTGWSITTGINFKF